MLAAVAALRAKYEDSTARKAALEAELADLEAKLERAERLVTGLAGERARWEGSIADLEGRLGRLPVRCRAPLLAPDTAACLAAPRSAHARTVFGPSRFQAILCVCGRRGTVSDA